MSLRKDASRRVEVVPRLRFMRGAVIVLGPGKADLLEAIERAGSVRAAASALGMSYMRAWSLVRVVNTEFRSPLVRLERGGTAHGGASLTPLGRRVALLYREMERAALDAVVPGLTQLRKDLRR
ncbi:MAG: winged helix-turn-helix domain-containing protein [Thermoanaerobaculia bacterium]